jgi:hypothetical protein
MQERRRLAELTQTELGHDSFTPESNVATLVQRILKSGVLSHKTVEYRWAVSVCVCGGGGCSKGAGVGVQAVVVVGRGATGQQV